MTFKTSWVLSVSNRCNFLMRAVALLASATSALAVTTTYTTQTASMNQLRTEKNNSPPYAGTYDNGSELAQYANSGWFGNTPGAAAFRTFTIDGRADLVWGDWELCFPFASLYAGDLNVDPLGRKKRVSRKPVRIDRVRVRVAR